MAKSSDIVGYMFNADIYCPAHIGDPVGDRYDGWRLAEGVRMSAEDNLDEIAAAFGIDREDETSFDSEDFPKVIFRDQAEGHSCGICGEPLD